MQFKARDFTPRTKESYNYHCSLLEGPLKEEDSVTYGLTHDSPLNKLTHFHVINQLPQDIMHVLLEGAVPYEVVRMLTHFITDKRYFSHSQLNDRIRCFAYTSQEARDKPSLIKPQVFASQGMRLSQTGQMFYALFFL